MQRCAVCGNDYDKSLSITYNGYTQTFDCFECAIHALAPECAHCHAKIIGHGVEFAKSMYCSAHCAREKGLIGFADRLQKIEISPTYSRGHLEL